MLTIARASTPPRARSPRSRLAIALQDAGPFLPSACHAADLDGHHAGRRRLALTCVSDGQAATLGPVQVRAEFARLRCAAWRDDLAAHPDPARRGPSTPLRTPEGDVLTRPERLQQRSRTATCRRSSSDACVVLQLDYRRAAAHERELRVEGRSASRAQTVTGSPAKLREQRRALSLRGCARSPPRCSTPAPHHRELPHPATRSGDAGAMRGPRNRSWRLRPPTQVGLRARRRRKSSDDTVTMCPRPVGQHDAAVKQRGVETDGIRMRTSATPGARGRLVHQTPDGSSEHRSCERISCTNHFSRRARRPSLPEFACSAGHRAHGSSVRPSGVAEKKRAPNETSGGEARFQPRFKRA